MQSLPYHPPTPRPSAFTESRRVTPARSRSVLIYGVALVALSLAGQGCDSAGTAGSPVSVDETTPFDTDLAAPELTGNPMFPTGSYSNGVARFGSEGVTVVDGRLHFRDVVDYVQFVQTRSTWTAEQFAEWETQIGYRSLRAHLADTTTSSGRLANGENLYVADDLGATIITPSGVVGIGDRVYDIEGDILKGYDLDGNQVGAITMIQPPDCDIDPDNCGGGGGGGGGGGSQPENPDAELGYGPVDQRQDTRDLHRYKGFGKIFRTHYWLYSSIGAETSNGRLRGWTFPRGYYYSDWAPERGTMSCTRFFEDGSTSSPDLLDFRTYRGGGEDTMNIYWDLDVFDFTGNEALVRIECRQSGFASNRNALDDVSGDPTFTMGSFTTSRNF